MTNICFQFNTNIRDIFMLQMFNITQGQCKQQIKSLLFFYLVSMCSKSLKCQVGEDNVCKSSLFVSGPVKIYLFNHRGNCY